MYPIADARTRAPVPSRRREKGLAAIEIIMIVFIAAGIIVAIATFTKGQVFPKVYEAVKKVLEVVQPTS